MEFTSNRETYVPKARARKFNMPDFLNDKNNNNITLEEDLPKLRPIGKIKSPFIENVNSIMKTSENKITQPGERVEVRRNSSFNKVKVISKIRMEPDESTDTNGDSGKENNENGIVSEARKKFSRAMSLNTVNSSQKSVLVQRSKTTSHVENKFAKYFGVQVKAELSPIPKPVLVNSKSFNQIGNQQQSFLSSTTANLSTPSIKRRIDIRHQMISAKKYRSKTITNGFPLDNRYGPGPITSFEDLQVTKEDLMNASKEFEKLFLGVEWFLVELIQKNQFQTRKRQKTRKEILSFSKFMSAFFIVHVLFSRKILIVLKLKKYEKNKKNIKKTHLKNIIL